MTAKSMAAGLDLIIEIGGIPVGIRSGSEEYIRLLADRYDYFVKPHLEPLYEFDVELAAPEDLIGEDDCEVRMEHGRWFIQRSGLRAEWDPALRRGWVVQSLNRYAIDTVIRILHSILLAKEGGMLVHAASAVKDGKAFIFTGLSGAGKTTISRLAPKDVTLLTDEISYVSPARDTYYAHGTPFAGELAKIGADIKAPLAAIFFLNKGPDNIIEPVKASDALQMLMRNILFFANDSALVQALFHATYTLVSTVPVYRLTFFPNERVWELIA